MADRLELDTRLRKSPSLRCIAIDDFEYPHVQAMLRTRTNEIHHATAVVRSKPQGRPTATGFSANHEYVVFWGHADAKVGRLPAAEAKRTGNPHSDEHGIYSWANFRKSGTDSNRSDRPKSYYPVFVINNEVHLPEMEWDEDEDVWKILEEVPVHGQAVWPIDGNGTEKVWTCSPKRAKSDIADIRVERDAEGSFEIYKKYRPNQTGALPGTWWDDSEYSASESGTKILKDMFGSKDFDYPKSVNLVVDSIRVGGVTGSDVVLDYFAGSGTTGHAVVNLNREDGGRRRFLLVEMGDYCNTVLVPRLRKVVFTPEWKDGKPVRPATSEEVKRAPRIIKSIRLESYEDALNNLELKRTIQQASLIDEENVLREQYILSYMLDVESRGSQSLS